MCDFEALVAVFTTAVFRDVTPCSMVHRCQRFAETSSRQHDLPTTAHLSIRLHGVTSPETVTINLPHYDLNIKATCPNTPTVNGSTFSKYIIFLKSTFRNKASFYDEQLLAPRTIPNLEDHPLSAVRDCLFNIFAATLHGGEI